MMATVGYKPNNRLTAEEIEVRVWAFVIVILVTILLGAMVAFLYSVTYVTQPMAGMAPIDKIYTQQISTIMVFITGVLGGVAGRSGIKAVANAVAKAEANDTDEPPKP
jgi:nitric oxide reductase large subunit